MRNILFATLIIAMTHLTALATAPNQIQEELTVNLVELEVKAQTLGGKFIPGLTADDFVVTENGKRQKIESIEEVRLDALPDEEAQDYRSRTMIIIDLKNSQYLHIRKVFPELREYVQTLYDGKTEIGLALNTNGIIEVLSFTRDRELLMEAIDHAEDFVNNRKNLAIGQPNGESGFQSRESNVLASPSRSQFDPEALYTRYISDHHRRPLDVFGQFVRYLGSFTGKKNIIFVTQLGGLTNSNMFEGDNDLDGVISIRDIQTICMYNKVAINILNVYRGSDLYLAGLPRPTALNPNPVRRQRLDIGANLASATAGFTFRVSPREVDEFVEHTVKKSNRYYRIRYYSNYTGDRFRNVAVRVKGLGKVALNLDGYYPKSKNVSHAEAGASLAMDRNFQSKLTVDTDWMEWTWFGWGKRRAHYLVAQKAFDDNGRLVHETIFTGELQRRKRGGSFTKPVLEENLSMELPPNVKPVRVETQIVDLTSGKQVSFVQQLEDGRLI